MTHRDNRKERLFFIVVLIVFCITVTSGAGIVGYVIGRKQETGSIAGTGNKADLGVFWDAWGILDKRFYGDVNNDKRVEGAIGGMVAGLEDPYTVYLPPKQNKMFRSDLAGNFGGIGAELEYKDSLLTIVAPLQGTPAEKAGLQPKDIIAEIDGAKVSDMNYVDAIDKIRGDKGTQVTLTIVRPGVEKPISVSVTRDTIVVKSVESTPIPTEAKVATETNKDGQQVPVTFKDVQYVKLNQFGEDTAKLLSDALTAAVTDHKRGAIIDLRNNPGGLLDKAVETIGMVLPNTIQSDDANLKQRVAVREVYKDKPEDQYRATNAPIADTLPLVVLVNSGSASASEIFAGAMKDYGRAKIVGVKTFGKGSVQDLVDLKNGGSIKVTIAHWLTPLGHEINKKGVDPDVEVALPDGQKPSMDDIQVQKALSLLGAQQ